ncbi:MAG: helix-turn-helix domain-containing protein [Treponema sp.]|nr:helix-turn-helix domain-containing protein [Treponema sp.]
MDCQKVGSLIRRLRLEGELTQLQLGELLGVSDKAVSKWERGLGCPDLSLISKLVRIFHVDTESLLAGELNQNLLLGVNMKKLIFYVCPECGNIVTAMATTSVTCCGRKLQEMEAIKASPEENLQVDLIENEFFISSTHEMTKQHYISFVALVTGDTLMVKKLYPEWNLQARIPQFGHGKLVWYCTNHGLFYQLI